MLRFLASVTQFEAANLTSLALGEGLDGAACCNSKLAPALRKALSRMPSLREVKITYEIGTRYNSTTEPSQSIKHQFFDDFQPGFEHNCWTKKEWEKEKICDCEYLECECEFDPRDCECLEWPDLPDVFRLIEEPVLEDVWMWRV